MIGPTRDAIVAVLRLAAGIESGEVVVDWRDPAPVEVAERDAALARLAGMLRHARTRGRYSPSREMQRVGEQLGRDLAELFAPILDRDTSNARATRPPATPAEPRNHGA